MGEYEYPTKLRPRSVPAFLYHGTNKTMRVRHEILNCAVFIYGSEKMALRGEADGANGFFVRKASEAHPDYNYFYIATNAHVVEDLRISKHDGVFRINKDDGMSDIEPIDDSRWILHPDFDDLAIYPIVLKPEWAVTYLPYDSGFLGPENVYPNGWCVGAADETILVGRMVGYSGKQANTPVVCSGHIAMVPSETEKITQVGRKISTGEEFDQLSFLVETHTVKGYSGSPVFVPVIPNTPQTRGLEDTKFLLLGIEWGYPEVSVYNVGDYYDHPSGMSAVVPGWKLKELIDMPEAKRIRDEADKTLPGVQAKRRAKMASGFKSADNGLTEQEFDGVLRKVTRKVDKPDQKKRG
jgi:hypothetical protein